MSSRRSVALSQWCASIRSLTLGFGVAAVGGEVAHQPAQHGAALAPTCRDLLERPRCIDEVFDDFCVGIAEARDVDGRRARRLEHGARQALQRLPLERMPAGRALGPSADETLRLEDRQMMRDGRLLEVERRGQLLDAPFPLGQKSDDAQPAFVRHGLEEVEQRFVGHADI